MTSPARTAIAIFILSAHWALGIPTSLRDAADGARAEDAQDGEPESPGGATIVGPGLRARLDGEGRLVELSTSVPDAGPAEAASPAADREVAWLAGLPSLRGLPSLQVEAETTGTSESPRRLAPLVEGESAVVKGSLPGLALDLVETWAPTPSGISWTLVWTGGGPRAGHEVTVDLPVLTPARRVFTPTERGIVDVGRYPSFALVPYGTVGWSTGTYHVLPLVSVLDPETDRAITISLPPDPPIPHLQVSWEDARMLRLRLANRAMGEGRPAMLRILFHAHRADYRSAIRAYSDEFPRWFRPALPRGPHEGAFWYHHIHDRPDFEELARQDVRFFWASFWFTHLGEYLPAESEWRPYTYARWWELGELMGDRRIRDFVAELHGRGIGTFAYFNVTEYGGYGGGKGDAEDARRRLEGEFADALIRRADGSTIPTWEGALAMNCRPDAALFPFLREQLRRHLERLPEIDGFCIDRLDWASVLDHGRSDGLTMLADREVELLAGPVARGVEEVCRQAHAAGKRVYVNQFWRVEMLRDVDGYCHEYDYPRGLGYLAPYRPASAWNHERPYSGDLLAFEAQLKLRLQFAIFPQMIARSFPISQQAPDPEAAGMLEIFAPLFATLRGTEQVLLPHPVSVTGPNDANLFRDDGGRYVVPVTSRAAFLSRGEMAPPAERPGTETPGAATPRTGTPGATTLVRLAVPDAKDLRWAHVVSAGAPTRSVAVGIEGVAMDDAAIDAIRGDVAVVALEGHATSSVVIVGKGPEPEIPGLDLARGAAAEPQAPRAEAPEPRPVAVPEGSRKLLLAIRGESVGAAGSVFVEADRKDLGVLEGGRGSFVIPVPGSTDGSLPSTPEIPSPPEISIRTGDEGTWLVPQEIRLLAEGSDGTWRIVGLWDAGDPFAAASGPRDLRPLLRGCEPREVALPRARFAGRDLDARGAWRGRYGTAAAWIARGGAPAAQAGFRLEVERGREFVWAERTEDPRALEDEERRTDQAEEAVSSRSSTCWFDDRAVVFRIEPPDGSPYRLTVYILDHDRNGRALTVRVGGDLPGMPSIGNGEAVLREESAGGVYLSWTVEGPVRLEVEKVLGFNAVASGVFVDRGSPAMPDPEDARP